MALVEKILVAYANKKKVRPGGFINVRAELILANDITVLIASKEFQRIRIKQVFDPPKIVMVADHFTPNKDIAAADRVKLMREFTCEQGILYSDVGQMGKEHALLPQPVLS